MIILPTIFSNFWYRELGESGPLELYHVLYISGVHKQRVIGGPYEKALDQCSIYLRRVRQNVLTTQELQVPHVYTQGH